MGTNMQHEQILKLEPELEPRAEHREGPLARSILLCYAPELLRRIVSA